ncbi:MAG: hypothetical protein GYA55_06755 [SAR324 cluster bacterium]|uniref:Lipoprotein n=1 Tax=SAR324 cluster bacterium TaxID=2024889 RepID=A0A7X9FRB6_9DELT|nr:hypothetical protein [SAR324 cluster bacterium]
MKIRKFILFLIPLICGCAMMQMKVPQELFEKTSVYEVNGRNDLSWSEKYNFGPFSVEDFHRSGTETTRLGIDSWNISESTYSFEFVLTGPKGRWQGKCSFDMNRQHLSFDDVFKGSLSVELDARTLFVCKLDGSGEQEKWILKMNQESDSSALQGMLVGEGRYIKVQGTSEIEGSAIPLSTASGYFFMEQGKFLGAVDVVNNGRVFLPHGLDENVLAAASTALLYYKAKYPH